MRKGRSDRKLEMVDASSDGSGLGWADYWARGQVFYHLTFLNIYVQTAKGYCFHVMLKMIIRLSRVQTRKQLSTFSALFRTLIWTRFLMVLLD